MAGIFSKGKKLLKNGNYKELSKKTVDYVRFIVVKIWYLATFKETDSDLKKVNKNWVFYTYLKAKYKYFLSSYKRIENKIHEYSDFVWWCWLQGEENAPELCKACLESVRRKMPNKKIVVITNENLYDYVDFPDFIKEKYKNGKISNTHFSDLIRLQLLIKYGGTWIDATVFCSDYPEYAFNTPLFVFKTSEKNDPATVAQNWFMSTEKNEPILTLTRDLLFDYWNTHNNAIHYFIFYFFMKLAADFYKEEWNNVPWFSDLPPHIMQRELNMPYSGVRWQQLCRMSDIHKLSYKIVVNKNEDTFYKHLLNSKTYRHKGILIEK